MENIINRILEMDEQARSLTRKANQKKVKNELSLEKRKHLLKDNYIEKARKKLSDLEQKERETGESEWAEKQALINERADTLDKLYVQNREKWISGIFERSLGKGDGA